MKILTSEQCKLADAYTIAQEPIASIDLMERASTGFLRTLLELPIFKSAGKNIYIFCGMGNNGGDGLAIARLLHGKGYFPEVFVIKHRDKGSLDFLSNEDKLRTIPGINIQYINHAEELMSLTPSGIIIDALLGTGFSGTIEGIMGEAIKFINMQRLSVVSVDIPSGLFADKSSAVNSSALIVHANYTLTFELPKLAFMFPENSNYIGDWRLIPISLDRGFLNGLEVVNFLLDSSMLMPLLKKRGKFDHKGNYGHALIIAGSKGKMGAARLSAEACLRSGAGLLTAYVPECGYIPMQSSLAEAMVITDSKTEFISERISFSFADAICIGPGIGKNEETAKVLKLLLQDCRVPLLLDADALNILSENKTWISFIPPGSILTPHLKEFERLCGKSTDSFERQKKQLEFALKYEVFVVLKGAHTTIACPDGRCYFNSTGNPGMATAGSGDVLSGIITGFLACGYKANEACMLGVYLHGLAGDLAASQLGMEAMIAGDIISFLSDAFIKLHERTIE